MSRSADTAPHDVQTAEDGVTISEASDLVGISIDAIRYYEREGLTLRQPVRGATGWRRYDDQDLGWLRSLVMLRGTGMTIAEMREYAAAYRAGASPEDRLALLKDHHQRVIERLDETQRHLAALDRKIRAYEANLVTNEQATSQTRS